MRHGYQVCEAEIIMKYEINQQTEEIIDSLNITDEEKDFIFQHIENAYYRGHTDGYLDGYSNGYEEGHCVGYYEDTDDIGMNQQEQLDI